MALVIESGDCTQSGNNTSLSTLPLTMPSYADGDLIIVNLGFWQNNNDTTAITWPSGPNSETITSLETGYGGSGDFDLPMIALGWFIGDGSYAGGTFNITVNNATRFDAGIIVVPDGEFDDAKPLSTALDKGYSTADDTTPDFEAFTANSDDADGKLVCFVSVDQDPISGTPTGWTDWIDHDQGRSSIVLSGRDSAVTASESISASGGWTIANDAWTVYAYIVRAKPAGPTITDVESDEDYDDKDTGITITGTTFGATKGSGKVEMGDSATYATANKVEQTTTSWADTSIDFTANLGSQSPGTKYIFVTDDDDNVSSGFEVTVHRANAFTMSLSSNFSPGVTTAQLTAPSGKTTGDFSAGRIEEVNNPTSAVDIDEDEYTEIEWCFKGTANVEEVQYDFRVLADGEELDTYSVTPAISITLADELTANGITGGAPTLGDPTLAQTNALSAAGLTSGAPVLGSPTIGQVHALDAVGITTGNVDTGNPAAAHIHDLTASGLTADAPVVDSAAIGQIHVLSAPELLSGSPDIGTPGMGQTHGIAADGISAGNVDLGTPDIGQAHDLTAAGLVTGNPEAGAATIVQVVALSASGLASAAPVLGSPTIGQVHALDAVGIATGVPEIGTPGIEQIHDLAAAGIAAGAPDIDQATIGQVH
ncbi:MAG: hypothetical protein B6I36_09860, partial [Desulfobacteraceae bacterium 4572_35.1]